MSSNDSALVKHEVAHHFHSAEQEFDSAKLGMWLFLAQEILFFGGLFCAYVVYRVWYPEMYADMSSHLDWRLGFLNTVVLITSSFTMVMGVRAAQLSNMRSLKLNLAATFFLALAFMVVKYFEYMEKLHHGLLPGFNFAAADVISDRSHVFIGLYFMMTGLHGLHVLIGMGLLAWLYILASKGRFHAKFYTPVELTGLYWHLVDMIWIFLFPLLYLI